MKNKHVIVIGAGYSGLATACLLAKENFKVTVLEKNHTPGGRARQFSQHGFTFDMGPSWYWMPDVFERFFENFGQSVSDHYQLERLDPSYRVFLGPSETIDIPADYQSLRKQFESIEPGCGPGLDIFLAQAKKKYQISMDSMVYKPGKSILEFMNVETLKGAMSLDLTVSFEKHLQKFFKDPRLIQILTFPILFLGAGPKVTPAMYSLMNYADIALGTWYPKGGMFKIVEAMVDLAKSLGVDFHFNQAVQEIQIESQQAAGVTTTNMSFRSDYVVSSADYHFTESKCLPAKFRTYNDEYWERRVMAPSSLIFYLGLDKEVDELKHHNLFFDEDLALHIKEIYDHPQWPSKPLFYVCAPSKTDETVCPPGHENLFILIPVATGLDDQEDTRERYFDMVMDRLEEHLGRTIRESICFKKSYAHSDFLSDYNAFKGNAYGLANTLRQTAIFKPGIQSKKVSNLYYTGQLTVPGPGVPPSLISGQIVASEILKHAS